MRAAYPSGGRGYPGSKSSLPGKRAVREIGIGLSGGCVTSVRQGTGHVFTGQLHTEDLHAPRMSRVLLRQAVPRTYIILAISDATQLDSNIAMRDYGQAGRSSLMVELSTMPIPSTSAEQQTESSGGVQWQVAIIGQPLQTANQARVS